MTRANAAWWSVHRVDDEDPARLLRTVGWGAWAALALYAIVAVTLACLHGATGASAVEGSAGVAALVAGAALIVSPAPTPLPRWRVVCIVALALFAVVVFSAQDPWDGGLPDHAAWYQGLANFLFFGLALRARVMAAWIGEAAMLTCALVWSVAVTGSPSYGIAISYGQPISLLAGTVFALALNRTAIRIVEFRDAERQRVTSEAARSTASAVQERELRVVREQAEPLLRRIAEGLSVDASEAVVLEAALRDQIRGRALAVEPLTSALRTVRLGGADVVVLDDLQGVSVSPVALESAIAWCATALSATSSDSITVRLAPTPTGAILTIVGDGVRHERTISSSLD